MFLFLSTLHYSARRSTFGRFFLKYPLDLWSLILEVSARALLAHSNEVSLEKRLFEPSARDNESEALDLWSLIRTK